MKTFSIISAACVALFLYLFVFERERLTFDVGSEALETSVDEVAGEKPKSEAPLFRVVVTESQEARSQAQVTVRGEVQAAREVRVAAETSGVVISEPLKKGQFVNTGDALCEIDVGTREARLAEAQARLLDAEGRVPEAKAALAEAQARVKEAETSLNAARKLNKDGYASDTRVLGAEANLEAAMAGVQRANSAIASAQAGIETASANIDAAQKELDNTIIRAPFSGILETDTTELGVLMQKGSVCAHIVQLDQVKLVGYVTEAEINQLEDGSAAVARFTSGMIKQGNVSFLSRSADSLTRTFQVNVEVDNSDLNIRSGQSVEIEISTSGVLAHALPQSALTLNDDGLLGVRAVSDDNIVEFHPVTMLKDTPEFALLAGLPPSLNVITVGQGFVREGVRVDPVSAQTLGREPKASLEATP